jgi:hypothetical protein
MIFGMFPTEGADRTAEAASFRALLEATRSNPSHENLVSLGDAVAGKCRYDFDDGPERRALIEELVAGITAIPGHATAFAEEVEHSHGLALKMEPSARGSYNMLRSRYLSETLRYFPSPETVQVLGNYLGDERDTPDEELPHDGPRELDYVSTPENAWLALGALSNIGLRDAPIEPERFTPSGVYRHGPEMTEKMRRAREWYADVKEGRKKFSFVGKKAEYCFKPDGTWETASLAISDEVIREEQKRLSTLPPHAAPIASSEVAVSCSFPSPSRLPWMVGAMVLLTAGGWFVRKRFKTA